MSLNSNDTSDLFTIACRGAIASAFIKSGVMPSKEQWGYLRDPAIEITLRDLSEVSYATGIEITFSIEDKS